MSILEQSGDSFDFCVLFRVYFTGKGADLIDGEYVELFEPFIGIVRDVLRISVL